MVGPVFLSLLLPTAALSSRALLSCSAPRAPSQPHNGWRGGFLGAPEAGIAPELQEAEAALWMPRNGTRCRALGQIPGIQGEAAGAFQKERGSLCWGQSFVSFLFTELCQTLGNNEP